MPWTIELTEDGRFSISSSAPGTQVEAAYERQKRINDRLGGRMVAAYIGPGTDVQPALLTEIVAAGFEVLVIAMETTDQYEALVAEVEAHSLWDPSPGLSETAVMTSPGNVPCSTQTSAFKAACNSRSRC